MSESALRWDAPGPYEVVFSTRVGGVSQGPFASLNIGRRTGDDVELVDENRRILCAEIGADVERLALNFQVHGTTVNRAEAGVRGRDRGDALWTEEPGLPMLTVTADCVPIALVRIEGKPAAAVVHAGRIGLLAGTVETAVQTVGGRIAAAVGPSAGPCCYEVGDEVAQPFRQRFGAEIVHGRKVNLWHAAESALHEAGVVEIHRFDLCTICNSDLFFSHRRDGKPRGVQGALAVIR
jgi:purine-nucleoside/S-methyl-5'-thioadenosine phosphorylase / adenosine deaminase